MIPSHYPALSSADCSELDYYEFCREKARPYFGPIMWASQGLPLRHVAMQELVRLESSRVGTRRFDILEVGSWAGGSAITWSEALARQHRRHGRVICVDPWKPYFRHGEAAGCACLPRHVGRSGE